MLKYSNVDAVFAALGDPMRRAILELLSQGPSSVTALAAPLRISVAAVLQHVDVLGDAKLINSDKVGRVRLVRLDPAGMRIAEKWLSERRLSVEAKLDRLEALLDEDLAPLKKRKKS